MVGPLLWENKTTLQSKTSSSTTVLKLEEHHRADLKLFLIPQIGLYVLFLLAELFFFVILHSLWSNEVDLLDAHWRS